jgi:hypothetical protein
MAGFYVIQKQAFEELKANSKTWLGCMVNYLVI